MLFVDPAGDDSGPGTVREPFATLERARAAAQPGAVVSLRAGVYRLTEPFLLQAADSGVTYQAYEGEKVVISGGRQITGWRKEADGTYTAEVPDLAFRQLYVSGRRAGRASLPLREPLSRTATGYTGAPVWPGDVELVYQGVYPWSEARIPVVESAGGTLTMAQPAFGWATELYHSVIRWNGPEAQEAYGVDNPTSAENSPAFLTPGTFALSAGVLHYLPLPGEEVADVVAPVLETLVRGENVHDVVFRGVTFADATWLHPSSPQGFLHYHGNGYHNGGETFTVEFGDGAGSVVVPADAQPMPGNIVLTDSARITFDGCHFTRLGGVALEFRGDSDGHILRDSVISDVAGGGVVIGGEARDCRIENNHVHHVGLDYRGSPAILLSGTKNAVVAHNEVNDVPHAGIVVYSTTRTQVVNNLVHNTMQALADGGGIYLSGPQGTSYDDGAVVRGNVVRDTITPYNFALYTDYGAAWITVQDNVIHRNDKPVVLEVSPPLDHVSFVGNYWNADPGTAPDTVTLAGNTVLSEDQFATHHAVAAIVTEAGRH
ncbi:MAG: right-handed parallel beta-helix repeat-containing protein [Kibdelosporangium sp.]